MADLYLTPAEKYTAALGGFYYGDLPEPGTVYTQLIKDILDGATPQKEPKNILARFIYSLYISDLGDPYPRYELAKLLYWKLHDITPTKSGSILTVTIDGKEDYMTINTDLSRLWYKVLFGSKTDVITEFPYIFNTMQNKLSDWELFGNTVQNGTPTPDSPIMPQCTGERTGNLFNKDKQAGTIYVTETVTRYGVEIPVSAGTYSIVGGTNRLFVKEKYGTTYGTPIDTSARRIITLPQNGYILVYAGTEEDYTVSNVMLNTDSTPLPYENYGYKIPISCGGTTNNVYLGEVETTRKIKKLVLTGEEDWLQPLFPEVKVYRINVPDYLREIDNIPICTHYKGIATVAGARDLQDLEAAFLLSTSGNNYYYIRDDRFNNANDFKIYLQQQYAAGTPVTIWYVLANEETGIVNEPLMKIGSYADSLSMAQTGIDIQTVIGQNTLDVLTTVKPSSMRIEYTSADETRFRSKRISLLKSPLKKGLIK